MNASQDIIFGVSGQVLVLEADVPIASVTSVSVWDSASPDTTTAESATTGSAAVDSATEFTTAASGYGQTDATEMAMASTAGFVAGRRGYISGAGMSETFEIERVDTAAIYARRPLVNAYASGATVNMTTRATIAVASAWASDTGNLSAAMDPNPAYRVRWEVVTIAGDTAVYFRNFDLVRYPSSPPVSPLDVDRAHPGWIDALPPDYRASQGRPLIEEATRLVRLDLYSRRLADQALRTGEVYAALVIDRAVWSVIEANGMRGGEVATALAIAKDRYDRRLAGLVESAVLAVDSSGGGASTSTTASAVRMYVR